MTEPIKTAMITTTALVLLTGISAVALAFIKQKQYPPFKAKQLPAVAVSLVAACFWLLGTLQALSVFDLTNPAWANCNFWTIWSQLTFGKINLIFKA